MLPKTNKQHLHPEIISTVELNEAHGHKIYYSGRLIRRVERQADGQRPANDEGWIDVWAQLSGVTLSTWDMKQIEEARKQGTEAPPTYLNVTDAFVRVVGTINVPETYTSPAQKYDNVLTLNTAGCNLILFSCPSVLALTSLASALRLCIWEKSRLEEIYTAHMIKTFLGGE
jgi:CCR4-NOT transcriptional complex subunit CAF120